KRTPGVLCGSPGVLVLRTRSVHSLAFIVIAALGIVVVAGSVVIVPVVIGAARVDVAGGRLDIHHRRGGDVNRIVVVIARAIDRGVEAGAVVAAAAVVSSAVVAVAEVAAVVVDGSEAKV